MTSNLAVFEAFVNGRTLAGRNVRSERLPSGQTVLYSYSTPVALRHGDAVTVDDRRYSVTTSKQLSGTILPAHRARLDWRRVEHETFRATARAAGANLRYAR